MRRLLVTVGASAGILLVTALLPNFYRTLLVQIAIWAIFAVGLDLIFGHGGLPSLGHAVFFGLGGYTVGVLSARHLLNNVWPLEILVAIAFVAAISALLGLFVLRTKGLYFMMVSLAIGQIAWGIAQVTRGLTGGDDGLRGISQPEIPLLSALPGKNGYFYLVVLFAVFVFAVSDVINRAPFGYAVNGLRQSESRMAAIGYNVFLCKYLAFIMSAAIASFAGALFAYYNQYIHPNSLNLVTSVQALLIASVGGAGTLLGPAVGALAVVGVQNLLAGLTERWQLPMGAFYIVVVLAMPLGIVRSVRRFSITRSGRTSAGLAKAKAGSG